MSDHGLKSFEKRLARIDRIHAAGGAFEATGALGRSYFDSMRPRSRRAIPFRAIALLFVGALLFKGAIFAQLGAETYDARVGALAQGTLPEQVGAWVLHADPVTRGIGDLLHRLIY